MALPFDMKVRKLVAPLVHQVVFYNDGRSTPSVSLRSVVTTIGFSMDSTALSTSVLIPFLCKVGQRVSKRWHQIKGKVILVLVVYNAGYSAPLQRFRGYMGASPRERKQDPKACYPVLCQVSECKPAVVLWPSFRRLHQLGGAGSWNCSRLL